MGLFKSVKDMKNMVHEAPGLIDQSNQLAASAKAMAAAQQAAGQQAWAAAAPVAAPAAPADAVAELIAGVSLELYAEIARSFAEVGYDQSRGPELAARHGVSADDWAVAMDGWNGRIAAEPAIASRFNALYTGR
ncbi:MAG: hypothetical protein JWO77_545 [Ilumatobacteraceae bacterium]|nr:hypothetical protein [Ilumatobacteraceae bacterium]